MSQKHSDYVEIVKDFGESAISKAILKGAIKRLPFLAMGFWNYFAIKSAMWLAEGAADQAEMQVFFDYVDFRTSNQSKGFDSAMVKNHSIQQTGTDDEKKKSEAELAEALNAAVSLKR